MADNIVLNAGAGGSTIATDDDGTAHHQYVKLEFGADNTQTKVSAANPLPVIGASNSGVDIGDVTINNAAGASGVPVQGGAATDAAVAGNPLLAGARASAAAPTDMSADGDAVPLWATLKGALNVADGGGTLSIDDGAGSITVDGTVAVSGTVAVTDNSGSLTVDNGGTFVVQENGAALTSLQLIDDVIVADDAAFTPATTKVAMAGFTFDDVAPDSVNEGDAGAARMSANRNIYVNIRDNAGNERGLNVDANGAIAITAASLPSHAVTNAGTFAVQADSVVPGTGATNLGKAEDAAHSSGDVGVMALGVRASSPTERSAGPTDGDYEPFATNEVGAMWTTLTPSVNGGLSTAMFSGSDGSSILVATAQAVKASAGALYGYYAYNPEAAVTFVHFYNTAAASVTVGTTNPLMSFAIPAGSAANLSFPMGVTFSNAGWSVAATTTAGGNTAPATGVSLVVWYK